MRILALALLTLVLAVPLLAQAAPQPTPAGPPPTLEQVRAGMGIASSGDVRGQQDKVGFASTPEQMARVWALSATPPAPESFGTPPKPGVAGVLCPHDDYIYAGRVYRQVLPLVTARTVVLVGVFHKYRRFGAHDTLVFDPYRAWRSPDGDVPVSPLRDEVLAALPRGEGVQDAAMHDSEHSLEALVFWLRHANPEVQILPIIVPAASLERQQQLAAHLATALADAMKKRCWQLGRDVAIAISTDGVHYGSDFAYTPYGEGGVEAYVKATAKDREILRGPLSGPLTEAKVAQLYSTCNEPSAPGQSSLTSGYRLTWCGRFSIPLGLLLLRDTAAALGIAEPIGRPVAYSTSIGLPELPVRDVSLGETAQANLYHFVSYPAVAFE